MGTGQEREAGGGGGEKERPRTEGADAADARQEPSSAAFDARDTTSWGGAAPPVLIEDDEETIISVPEPEPEPDAEVETGAAVEAESEPAPAGTSAEEAEAVTLPPDESPEILEEEPTVISVPLGPAAAAGTLVAQTAPASPAEEAETIVSHPTEDVTTPRTIAPSSSLPPMLLERIEPSMGRGERTRLDVRHWHVRLGRAEENEIRLYTASASREHAVIEGNEEGQWIMTPSEGKAVFVDGEAISEPIALEVGMNLVMGKDHLRWVDEGLDRRGTSRTATEAFEGNAADWMARLRMLSPREWAGLGLAAFVLIAIAIWLGA